jgi:hypothetical protein
MRLLMSLLLACALLSGSAPLTYSQEKQADAPANNSLWELRDKRYVYLLVRRSGVVDASGDAKAIIEAVSKESRDARSRFPRTFNKIARKLNRYLKQSRNLSAASTPAEADFLVYFNLLEIRWPLGSPYAYGELFVILNERSESKQPRIIWKSKPNFAEDAIDELIKDLKNVRGES